MPQQVIWIIAAAAGIGVLVIVSVLQGVHVSQSVRDVGAPFQGAYRAAVQLPEYGHLRVVAGVDQVRPLPPFRAEDRDECDE